MWDGDLEDWFDHSYVQGVNKNLNRGDGDDCNRENTTPMSLSEIPLEINGSYADWNLLSSKMFPALVAQWSEQSAHNRLVGGSNPSGGKTFYWHNNQNHYSSTMKRYIFKVTFNLDVIAENETDARGAIQELDYNFLETTGCASLQRFEMVDMEIDYIHKLTQEEEGKYFDA